MISLAVAAAILAAQAWQPLSGIAAQATATVRIVSGQRVQLENAGAAGSPQPAARESKIRLDGAELPALLVEFS